MHRSERVVGVDGCRGGWLGAAVDGQRVKWLLHDAVFLTPVRRVLEGRVREGLDYPVCVLPAAR